MEFCFSESRNGIINILLFGSEFPDKALVNPSGALWLPFLIKQFCCFFSQRVLSELTKITSVLHSAFPFMLGKSTLP